MFTPKSLLSEELEGEECLNFCFIGLGEVLTSCLHTLLRDKTPCSSLPQKNVFVFVD
jgi:hypothetical protein